MKCPACSNAMTEIKVQEIAVEVCKGGCGGVWLDWMELKKLDEPHESLGEGLLTIERNEAVQVDLEARRNCPRCEDMVMMRHFASVKREVTVDECPSCGGYFLDHGELNHLRGQFATEEERDQAAEAVFDDLVAEGLADIREESAERVERSRGLARMFKFLLPSNYLKGKQKWGAY